MKPTKPCPLCSGRMLAESPHEACHECMDRARRAMTEHRPRLGKCARCGAEFALWTNKPLCWRCRKKDEGKTPHEGRRHGKKVVFTDDTARCKMPKCHALFHIEPYQDKRYTWYCPDCRAKIAEITAGAQWVGRMWGLDVLVDENGEDILMDSTAKAYDMAEEEPNEKTVRQEGVGALEAEVRDHPALATPGRESWPYSQKKKLDL